MLPAGDWYKIILLCIKKETCKNVNEQDFNWCPPWRSAQTLLGLNLRPSEKYDFPRADFNETGELNSIICKSLAEFYINPTMDCEVRIQIHLRP